jgi:anion-transporting  ArsA/GET3 family ATPase
MSDFFQSFGDMSEGFRARAERVTDLLASDAATFVLVTSPRHDAIEDAIFFHDQLAARGMPFGGVVVNRFHVARGDDDELDLEATFPPDLAAKIEANYADFQVLSSRDRANLRRLTERLSGEPVLVVPELDGDVHDLDGLAAMATHLWL